MKKMTKKELLETPLGEFFDYKDNHIIIKDKQNLDLLDIKLIEEKPPITIQNLERFMAKFGEYPKAKFIEDITKNIVIHGHLFAVCEGGVSVLSCKSAEYYIEFCEITDPRWTAENLGGEG